MSYPWSFFKLLRRAWRPFVAVLILALPVGIYALNTFSNDNFHFVVPGVVYRSAQLDADDLAVMLKRYSIRSVINLRGKTPDEDWYRAEMETSARLKVAHYDRALSARSEMNLAEMDALVDLLRRAPKPVLIHCRSGADRAGLASALYCLAIAGQKPVNADKQLTIWYGHFPMFGTSPMDHSFWRYVNRRPASQVRATASLASTPKLTNSIPPVLTALPHTTTPIHRKTRHAAP
jgi:protein tyrosine phosphatase (PTP) superfamily phosphohydrolase (DUF442 family)